MRLFPLLTAILVAAILYLAVIERDTLITLATGRDAAEASGDGTTETAAAPASETSPSDAASADAPDAATDAPARVAVVVRESRAQTINNAVLVRGRTEAARSVDVRAETSALVISEPRDRGSYVETGDVLCELDPGTRRAALAEAQARQAEAAINYRAADRLSQDGFAAETRVAAARAALQSTEAAVEAAEREIARLTIRAPFGGLLETDSAELGSLLQPGALCATILLLDPILLVGFIAETEVDNVEPGAVTTARLATGAEVQGTVSFLSRAADPQTRTFRVEVTVANPDLAIRDGQTAEMMIASSGVSAHLLPGSALTLNDEGTLGLRIVAEGDIARFAPVHVLRDTVEGVWVTGLPDEATVIVVGQEYVVDGVPVIPHRQEPTQ